MIEWVTERLMTWCRKRGRVMRITGTAGPDDVYLIRYYLIKSRWINVFIHQFLRSDRDDLHDHPWHFATYLVRGAYTERRWREDARSIEATRRVNKPCKIALIPSLCFVGCGVALNRLVFRRATDQHQVVVDQELKEYDLDLAPLTICVTGPTVREWGFWRNRAYKSMFSETESVDLWTGKVREFIPWRKYLGLPPDAPGRG